MNTELRPLTLGEILDRTAQLYRSHFLLFVGIAVFPRTLLLAWQLVQITVTHYLDGHHIPSSVFVICAVLFSYLLYFAFVGLGVAATSSAVSAIYLGQTATIASSYERVRQHWGRYIGVIFLSALYAWGPTAIPYGVFLAVSINAQRAASGRTGVVGLATKSPMAAAAVLGVASLFLLVSIPYGVWMTLRYALAVPAAIFEKTGIKAALKRSVLLTIKGRGRIFVMALMVGIVFWTIFLAAQMPFLIVIYRAARTHQQPPMFSQISAQLISFALYSVIGPVYAIAITLFYYDERIRKEGFDIEWMMERANLVGAGGGPTSEGPVPDAGSS